MDLFSPSNEIESTNIFLMVLLMNFNRVDRKVMVCVLLIDFVLLHHVSPYDADEAGCGVRKDKHSPPGCVFNNDLYTYPFYLISSPHNKILTNTESVLFAEC